MVDNPFVLVYNRLWRLVLRNSELAAMVPPKSRIKFDDELGMKENVSDSDKPELMLIEVGGIANLHSSSSHSFIQKNYQWLISTGTKNINKDYNVIAWELLRGMVDWDTEEGLCGLEWKNERFVRECRLMEFDTGELLNPQTRGIEGWASSWAMQVDMRIATANLRIT